MSENPFPSENLRIELVEPAVKVADDREQKKLDELFLKTKGLFDNRLIKSREYVDGAKNRLEALKLQLGEVDVENNVRLRIAYTSVLIKEHALLQDKNRLEFLRKPDQEDIAYRLDVFENWPEKVAEKVPNDLPLRFHGCSIYAARAILVSGEVSSSVDRLGFETSHDVAGGISVTAAKDVRISTESYTGLSVENMCLPAGCIFVFLPKDEEDERAGNSFSMGNVSFKDDPGRLFSIITTPENLSRVTEWANAAGISSNKIEDFTSFLAKFTAEPSSTDR